MEKIQKTITDPCIIKLKLNKNGSSINLISTKTKEDFKINCDYDRSVKLVINYLTSEKNNSQNESEKDNSQNESDILEAALGGTDNWHYIDISKWDDDPTKWEDNPWPIYLEYNTGAFEADGVFVDNLTYQQYAGDDNWCHCSRNKDGSLLYTAVTGNPYNKPRVAYFKHKTTDKILKYGRNIGYKVLSEWDVTVIQMPNPNGGDKEVTENELQGKYTSGPLYSIGIISDLHFNVNNNISQYKSDLKNALTYFKDNGVEFISSIGDLSIDDDNDLDRFEEWYAAYASNYQLRLFTCLGEYDYMRLYNKNSDPTIHNQITQFNKNKQYKDIKYFEYNGEWDKTNSGERNIKSKTNYYVIYNDDIYVYLSVDYGEAKYSTNKYLSRATNKLDYNDKYVKELIPFAIEGGYDNEIDGNFDYQFYNSNTLIWLKNIIENNLDKHIFVFMHHGLPHKAGNGTSYNKIDDNDYYSYYSKIYPYDSHSAIMKSVDNSGSNSLCGLQFYFLNNLNNKYKNVIWFSGHSHYRWEDGESSYVNYFSGDQYLNFCNKDFNIYKPSGNEHYNNPANSKSISKDYDKRIYTRYPNDDTLEDKPIGSSAWNIHIPSLSNPTTRTNNNELYYASEGAILDVYENGFKIRQILFKDEESYEYINVLIGEKRILFD